MPPSNHALNALLRTLLRQEGQEQDNYRNRSLSKIETINHDVFQLIALELYRTGPRELKPLASCSRALHNLSSSLLFSRCRRPSSASALYPPQAICPLIRHWTFWHEATAGDLPEGHYQKLLNCLPSLTDTKFHNMTLPWDLLRVCLSSPRITSISFSSTATLTKIRLPSMKEAGTISSALSHFSYDVGLWRFNRRWPAQICGRGAANEPNPRALVARESQCLAALVPHMNATLTQLLLPMESAPILKMAELPWPRLRELSINGSYWTAEQRHSLPVLLGALLSLEKLSIRISDRHAKDRPPILGQHSNPRSVLSGMRSLTVAYPDPDDSIFMIDTSHLQHLSISDCPRHYNSLIPHIVPSLYPIPLPSAACLSILQKMHLPELSSLELVYVADHAGADDDLLRFIATAFPGLAHLELHRYRADRAHDRVDHGHIARLLTAARYLRTLRLDLDFHEDPGLDMNIDLYEDFGSDSDKYYDLCQAWLDNLKAIGWEIVDIMQDCPQLCRVELLYHSDPDSTWVEFHPSRCAEPRFVLEYDEVHKEPELMPRY